MVVKASKEPHIFWMNKWSVDCVHYILLNDRSVSLIYQQ